MALAYITSNTYWVLPFDLSVIKERLMWNALWNNQPLRDVMVNPMSFHWAKTASLKTYHRADDILSQSTPCLAGLEWSDCRGQTTCHKKRIWNTLFSHTATCVRGCDKKRTKQRQRKKIEEGDGERENRRIAWAWHSISVNSQAIIPLTNHIQSSSMNHEIWKEVWFNRKTFSIINPTAHFTWTYSVVWGWEQPFCLCCFAFIPINVTVGWHVWYLW